MAKGNMLQGMARGKVGDVVFSRLNGQQISRVRNRQPYNPRTNKQLIQRAIMATVMNAYSAGKEIFNHSFQGKAVGSENQREFMRLNAKYLRGIIADDINNDVAIVKQKGRVVAPKATAPTASPLIISRGSYQNNFFGWDNDEFCLTHLVPQENETCKAFCERCGLLPGDLYTIVSFGFNYPTAPATIEDALKNAVSCSFYFIRLQVKADALTDNGAITTNLAASAATTGVPFIITDQKVKSPLSVIALGDNGVLAPGRMNLDTLGTFGVIRSRLDSDLRSDSEMNVIYSETMKNVVNGIASGYITEVWGAGAVSVGDSDLILEGGDI